MQPLTQDRTAERAEANASLSLLLGIISIVAPWFGLIVLGPLVFIVAPLVAAAGMGCGFRARRAGAGGLALAGIIVSAFGLVSTALLIIAVSVAFSRMNG